MQASAKRGALGIAALAAVALGGCVASAAPRQSAQAAAAGLDAELSAMAQALGAGPQPGGAPTRQYCRMYRENGSAIFLSRTIRVPNPPGALEAIRTRVVPAYQRQGWTVKDRGGTAEAAFTLEGGLYGLNLILRPNGRGDIVVMGATHCFEPSDS